MPSQKFRVQPPVGYPVQFYPSDNQAAPIPGFIAELGGSGSGLAKLIVFPPGVTTQATRDFVYHKDAPERAAKPGWFAQHGSWDFVPGMKRVGEMTPAEWEKQMAQVAAEAKAAISKSEKGELASAK